MPMGWRDHALRLLAEGRLAEGGEPFDLERMIAVFNRIEEDDSLSARLSELDEAGVRRELLALYREDPEIPTAD